MKTYKLRKDVYLLLGEKLLVIKKDSPLCLVDKTYAVDATTPDGKEDHELRVSQSTIDKNKALFDEQYEDAFTPVEMKELERSFARKISMKGSDKYFDQICYDFMDGKTTPSYMLEEMNKFFKGIKHE